MSLVAYRCNPGAASHRDGCSCYAPSPSHGASARKVAAEDAAVPHGPMVVAASWVSHDKRSAEHLLFAAEGCIPYNAAEVPVLIPALFPSGGATWNGHNVEVLYDGQHLPANIPAEIDVDENFFSLLLSQTSTLYALHGSDRLVFCYGDFRPRFITPACAFNSFPRMCNAPNDECIYRDGRFLFRVESIVGNWWCVSECLKYVCVRFTSAEEAARGYAVLTATQFLALFVPWWRGGPLYVGEPDCHRIPAHNRVYMGLNDGDCDFNVNGYPQSVGKIIGARDDVGALPVYDFGFDKQGAFPLSRSKWIAWASRSSPAAYRALYTGFKRSVPPPTRRFGDAFPPEVARHILRIIASDGESISGCEDRVIGGIKTFPLECGCSTFHTCSAATPVDREWLGHTKIPTLFGERVHHAGHGEEGWTPCDNPYVYHVFPVKAKCVHEITVKTLPPNCGTVIAEWGGLLCPQLDYGSRILKFTACLRRDLHDSHYAWEEMHYPWDEAYDVIATVGTVMSGIGLATYTEHEWNYEEDARAMLNGWDYSPDVYEKFKRVISHNQYYQWKSWDEKPLARPTLPSPLPPIRDVTIGDVLTWRTAAQQIWGMLDIRFSDPTEQFGSDQDDEDDYASELEGDSDDDPMPEVDDLIASFVNPSAN